MIFGAHVIVFSNDAAADRTFFAEVLGLTTVDAGAPTRIRLPGRGEVGLSQPKHPMAVAAPGG